jgi:hypothetical protein
MRGLVCRQNTNRGRILFIPINSGTIGVLATDKMREKMMGLKNVRQKLGQDERKVWLLLRAGLDRKEPIHVR